MSLGVIITTALGLEMPVTMRIHVPSVNNPRGLLTSAVKLRVGPGGRSLEAIDHMLLNCHCCIIMEEISPGVSVRAMGENNITPSVIMGPVSGTKLGFGRIE